MRAVRDNFITFSLLCGLTFGISAAADIPPPIEYPDHSKLLIVRDAAGNEKPVTTKQDWATRVGHIRTNMQIVMGRLPDESRRVPLDV
jgi:hypothetical protein